MEQEAGAEQCIGGGNCREDPECRRPESLRPGDGGELWFGLVIGDRGSTVRPLSQIGGAVDVSEPADRNGRHGDNPCSGQPCDAPAPCIDRECQQHRYDGDASHREGHLQAEGKPSTPFEPVHDRNCRGHAQGTLPEQPNAEEPDSEPDGTTNQRHVCEGQGEGGPEHS